MAGRVIERPGHRWTSLALTAGTLIAGACLAIGFVLSLLGADRAAGDPRQLGQVVGAVAALRPWGWTMLGVLVLVATPAAGLVATAIELRPTQPRAALLAGVVLAILVAATVVALR